MNFAATCTVRGAAALVTIPNAPGPASKLPFTVDRSRLGLLPIRSAGMAPVSSRSENSFQGNVENRSLRSVSFAASFSNGVTPKISSNVRRADPCV